MGPARVQETAPAPREERAPRGKTAACGAALIGGTSMSDEYSKALPAGRGVTLNSLRDQMYSLSMRLLLAMKNHDEQAQKDIQKEMAALQDEIDRLCLGGRYRF